MASSGYSGTPLPKKLGIKEGATVVVVNGPAGFYDKLHPLPEGVELLERIGGKWDVAIVFVERATDLGAWLGQIEPSMERGNRLWVAWPKKASGRKTDLNFDIVQQEGLGLGIVDTKVCAVDEVWSGLCFMRRTV